MSNEKKLVSLVKAFIERTCVPLFKSEGKLLKQWLYFSTLLSQQYIDYQRLEKYVETLNTSSSPKKELLKPPITNEQLLTDYDGFMRKKLQIVEKFKQTHQHTNFSLSKTYGGQRSPLRVLAITTSPEETFSRSGGKDKVKTKGLEFAKRLASLYNTFYQNDRKLQGRNHEIKLTRSFRQNCLM